MRSASVSVTVLALVLAAGALAQPPKKYTGPKPPKADMPYLLHATTLIPLEHGTATEEKRKDDTANVMKGSSSPARTPLAEPIFLLASEKLVPEKLELYRVAVSKAGNREVVMPNNPRKMKDAAKPIRLSVSKLDSNIFRLEATEALENGSYCLSPSGSQDVFCFDVY
jgi:hypothetical protein